MTEKTKRQLELIVSNMRANQKYKVDEVAGWLGVGRTRARTLLKLLVVSGEIAETGSTKMKRYRMIVR